MPIRRARRNPPDEQLLARTEIKVTNHHPDSDGGMVSVDAYVDRERVGRAYFMLGKGKNSSRMRLWPVQHVWVHKDHRRKGIALAMYAAAERETGAVVEHADRTSQTAAGRRFAARSRRLHPERALRNPSEPAWRAQGVDVYDPSPLNWMMIGHDWDGLVWFHANGKIEVPDSVLHEDSITEATPFDPKGRVDKDETRASINLNLVSDRTPAPRGYVAKILRALRRQFPKIRELHVFH